MELLTVAPPTADYVARQARLQALHEGGHRDGDNLQARNMRSEGVRGLQDGMAKEFAQTFGLTPSANLMGYRLAEYMRRRSHDPKAWQGELDLVDHESTFKRWGNAVTLLVVQPYLGKGALDLSKYPKTVASLQKIRAVMFDLNAWAWYYPGPGHAHCYGIAIDTLGQQLLKVYEKTCVWSGFEASKVLTHEP